MDNEKWNNVLLEWVNCLKLVKVVNNFEELKAGDFFQNLQKVITKSSEPNDDVLPFIFGLFAKHYPQFVIKSQLDLPDLSLDDVKAITTLLMHYTCIYDRRDVLTSPLCHCLSNSTQLLIKSFLEKVSSDISNEDLNRIIGECMSEVKHKDKTSDDPFIMRANEHFSPLQDLLRTPVAKPGRLQERDRIISKLKSDIELERYEKADLQEEVRIQGEKLKQIENRLAQKNMEISRLRDEIATLESTTPPNDKTEAVRELQRRLKAEIQSLEQYIRQIEAEQETIRQERDVANNKMRSLESQVAIWQEKFFETEHNLETLTENSKEQADELYNLRAHCSELTALLEDYRSQPKGHETSSFLENYAALSHCGRSSQSCEDLACSVVEVQLRDAKKQNEELESALREAETLSIDLRKKIQELTATLSNNQAELLSAQNSNQDLQIKFETVELQSTLYKQEVEANVRYLREMTQIADQRKEELVKTESERNALEISLEKFQNQLEVSLRENERLIKDLEEANKSRKELSLDLGNLNSKLEDANTKYDQIHNHKEELLIKVETLELEYTLSQKNLADTKQNLEKKTNLLKQKLEELENATAERKNLEFSLQSMKVHLDEAKKNGEDLQAKLEMTQEQMEQTQKKLERMLEESEGKIKELVKDRDELLILLHVTEKKLSETEDNFEKAVEHSKAQDGKLNTLEIELEEVNGILTETKADLARTMQENIELNVEVEEVKERLDLTKVQVEYLGDELKIADEKCRGLESEKMNLTEILDDLNTQHDLCQATLKDTAERLEQIAVNSKEKDMEITTLMTECESIRDSFKNTKDCLENIERENQALKTELAKVKQLSTQTIEDLQLDICEIQKSYDCLTKENGDIINKLQELECKHELCQENLLRMETDFGNVLEEYKRSQMELGNVRQDFENLIKEHEIILKQKEEVAKKNRNLERQLNELNEYSTKLLEQIRVTTCSFEESEKKCQVLHENESRLLTEIKMVQCKYEISQEKLMKTENELKIVATNHSNTLQSMKDYLGIMEGANEELKKQLNDSECKFKNEIEVLQAKLEKTRNDCEDLELDKQNLEEKVSALQMQCSKWAEQYTDLENKHVLLIEKSNTQGFEINELQINSSDLKSTIENFKNQLEIKESKIEALDLQLEECRDRFKGEIDTLTNELQGSRDNVKHLIQCKNELILQIELKETNKENLNNILTSTQKQLEEKIELLQALETENAQLKVQHGQLEELCKQHQEKNVDLEKRLGSTEKNYEEVENRLTEHIGLLQNARHDAGSLLDKLEELEDSHRALERHNTELLGKLESLEMDCANTKENFADAERELEQKNSDLRNLDEERGKLKEDLENITASADSVRNALNEQIDNLKETVARLEKETEKLRDNESESGKLKAQLDDELKSTVHKLRTSEEKCVNLEEFVEELQTKIQVLQSEYAGLEEQFETLNNELKIALQKYEETCKENNEFDQQLVESQELIAELQNKICELVREIEQLTVKKSEVSDVLAAQVMEYEQKCKSLERSSEDYCALFKEHEIAVQKHDKDIMMLEKEQEDSRKTIEKLMGEIAEKQNKIAEFETQLFEKDQGISCSLRKLKEKFLASEESNQTLIRTIERLEESLEKSRQIQKDEKLQKEVVLTELEMSKKAVEKLQNTFEELELDCQKLTKYNEELLSKVSDFENDKEKQMKEYQEEILEINDKLKEISTEKQSLLETIDAIKESDSITNAEKLKSLQDKIKRLEEMMQDYEITISGLKGVVESNLETISELRREKHEISNLLDATRKNAEKNERQDEKLIEVLKKYEIVGDAIVPEVIEEVLDRKKSTMEDLQSHNKVLNEMVERIQAIAMEKLGVDASLEALQDSLTKICSKIEEALQEKDQLSENCKKLIQEKDNLAKELADLKTKEIEPVKFGATKTQKENILVPSTKFNQLHQSSISKEEDLKKKNLNLKQKLVLAENAKSNLEKKLKLMREESKKSADDYSEIRYKNLLRENAKIKDDHQKKIKELEEQYENLRCQFEKINSHGGNQLLMELNSVREAYGKVVGTNSKLELEIVSLRRVIEQRNGEIAELCMVKEAYEKLLEDNNKLMTEVDTLKYKRNRDKDEYLRLLRKERDEAEARQNQKVRETRVEMEGKLQAMKDKMLRLYRDEMEEEKQRLKAGQCESRDLLRTVIELKSKLSDAEEKISLLEMERDMMKSKQFNDDYHSSFVRSELRDRNSIRSLVSMRNSVAPELPHRNPVGSRTGTERASTLPRFVEEQITISRRTSINSLPSDVVDRHNMQMEDEEDLFNNKYLTDLKEGRCEVPAIAGRESVNSRFSELAWRNSMVPQHLKSSYPAETQFYSPGHFKDDDIKGSRMDFESSSIKLLPSEKPRKKDFGTTSYKRPGPPTPSKNGGRLSLQGNEVHPVRLTPVEKTPKRSTPGRLRALFTSRNSTKDVSENNGTPSRSKRLNIFRKPK